MSTILFGGMELKSDDRVTPALTRCFDARHGADGAPLEETYSTGDLRFLRCRLCPTLYVVAERRHQNLFSRMGATLDVQR